MPPGCAPLRTPPGGFAVRPVLPSADKDLLVDFLLKAVRLRLLLDRRSSRLRKILAKSRLDMSSRTRGGARPCAEDLPADLLDVSALLR